MKRAIKKYVENPLASMVFSGDIIEGDVVYVNQNKSEDDLLTFRIKPRKIEKFGGSKNGSDVREM